MMRRARHTISEEEQLARYAYLVQTLPASVAEMAHTAAGPGDERSVAARFVVSDPVIAYFRSGAGSVEIDRQPPWLQELAGHDSAPVDAGRVNHRKGANMGEWFPMG